MLCASACASATVPTRSRRGDEAKQYSWVRVRTDSNDINVVLSCQLFGGYGNPPYQISFMDEGAKNDVNCPCDIVCNQSAVREASIILSVTWTPTHGAIFFISYTMKKVLVSRSHGCLSIQL